MISAWKKALYLFLKRCFYPIMIKHHAEDELFFLLVMRIARHLRRYTDYHLSSVGISQAAGWPLLMLARANTELRMSEIAETLGIEGPSLVRIVEGLVTDGLLSRRVDPQDKRAKLLKLTSRGEACIPALEKLLEHIKGQFLSDFDDDEFGIMLRGLLRVDRVLNRESHMLR
ncbi:MarR family winged helix-turn-helix transcriptional regulator [Xanthobacter sp. TB0139]|uniref:MarR family winged helix-turn-helix transcriptional regulator n=1 Tax=Xanthobacter sp. TB0139 TaxID=3459178 RepID=UPI0040398659